MSPLKNIAKKKPFGKKLSKNDVTVNLLLDNEKFRQIEFQPSKFHSFAYSLSKVYHILNASLIRQLNSYSEFPYASLVFVVKFPLCKNCTIFRQQNTINVNRI